MYSRNCYLKSPLGVAKTCLKQQVVYEIRVAMICPCKLINFFSSSWKWKQFFESQHTHLSTLISYIFVVQTLRKIGSKAVALYSRLMVLFTQNLVVVEHASQVLTKKTFLYKPSMQGILVLKTRWSLTTEIIKTVSTVHAMCTCLCTLYS